MSSQPNPVSLEKIAEIEKQILALGQNAREKKIAAAWARKARSTLESLHTFQMPAFEDITTATDTLRADTDAYIAEYGALLETISVPMATTSCREFLMYAVAASRINRGVPPTDAVYVGQDDSLLSWLDFIVSLPKRLRVPFVQSLSRLGQGFLVRVPAPDAEKRLELTRQREANDYADVDWHATPGDVQLERVEYVRAAEVLSVCFTTLVRLSHGDSVLSEEFYPRDLVNVYPIDNAKEFTPPHRKLLHGPVMDLLLQLVKITGAQHYDIWRPYWIKAEFQPVDPLPLGSSRWPDGSHTMTHDIHILQAQTNLKLQKQSGGKGMFLWADGNAPYQRRFNDLMTDEWEASDVHAHLTALSATTTAVHELDSAYQEAVEGRLNQHREIQMGIVDIIDGWESLALWRRYLVAVSAAHAVQTAYLQTLERYAPLHSMHSIRVFLERLIAKPIRQRITQEVRAKYASAEPPPFDEPPKSIEFATNVRAWFDRDGKMLQSVLGKDRHRVEKDIANLYHAMSVAIHDEPHRRSFHCLRSGAIPSAPDDLELRMLRVYEARRLRPSLHQPPIGAIQPLQGRVRQSARERMNAMDLVAETVHLVYLVSDRSNLCWWAELHNYHRPRQAHTLNYIDGNPEQVEDLPVDGEPCWTWREFLLDKLPKIPGDHDSTAFWNRVDAPGTLPGSVGPPKEENPQEPLLRSAAEPNEPAFLSVDENRVLALVNVRPTAPDSTLRAKQYRPLGAQQRQERDWHQLNLTNLIEAHRKQHQTDQQARAPGGAFSNGQNFRGANKRSQFNNSNWRSPRPGGLPLNQRQEQANYASYNYLATPSVPQPQYADPNQHQQQYAFGAMNAGVYYPQSNQNPYQNAMPAFSHQSAYLPAFYPPDVYGAASYGQQPNQQFANQQAQFPPGAQPFNPYNAPPQRRH